MQVRGLMMLMIHKATLPVNYFHADHPVVIKFWGPPPSPFSLGVWGPLGENGDPHAHFDTFSARFGLRTFEAP